MKTDWCSVCLCVVEGLLFDLKDGFCARPDISAAWQLNKEFCTSRHARIFNQHGSEFSSNPTGCRPPIGNVSYTPALLVPNAMADILLKNPCPAWRTWDSVIGPYLEAKEPGSWASWVPLERYMVSNSLISAGRARPNLFRCLLYHRSSTLYTASLQSLSPPSARA